MTRKFEPQSAAQMQMWRNEESRMKSQLSQKLKNEAPDMNLKAEGYSDEDNTRPLLSFQFRDYMDQARQYYMKSGQLAKDVFLK
jgi:hypothetical protein